MGRDDELARCRALIDEAASGDGGTVLITGEAGIGKSRFAAELVAHVRKGHWTVLAGACDEFSSDARPFGALREMLPAIEATIRRDSPAELESPAWNALERLAELDSGAGPQSASVAHLLSDLLRRLTDVRPVLVLIDDLHWADESTRSVFATLSRGLHSCRAVVAACYRANEIGRGHPLRTVLATVHRTSRPEVIELQPLDRGQLGDLAAGMGLDVSDIDTVLAQSGGVPFLAEELLAHAGPNVPAGIANVIVARIEALGVDAEAMAEAASLDTHLPMEVLESVTGIGPPASRAALDALVEAWLFSASGGQFSFRHAIGRDAVAEQIRPARRLELHALLADAFESVTPPDIARAARHWNESGDRPNTLRTSVQAAMQAAAAGAHPEAADLYERVFRLWEVVPGAAELAGVPRADLLDVYSETALQSWRFRSGVDFLSRELDGRNSLAAHEEASLWQRLGLLTLSLPPGAEYTYAPGEAYRRSLSLVTTRLPLAENLRYFGDLAGAMGDLGMDQEVEVLTSIIAELLSSETDPDVARHASLLVDACLTYLGMPPLGQAGTIRPAEEPSMAWAVARRAVRMAELPLASEAFHTAREFQRGIGRYPFVGTQIEVEHSRVLEMLGDWPGALRLLRELMRRLGSDLEELWPDMPLWGWGAVLMRSGQPELPRKWLGPAMEVIKTRHEAKCAPSLARVRVELARLDRDPAAARLAIDQGFEMSHGGVHQAQLSEAVSYAIGLLADLAERPEAAANEIPTVDRWLNRLEVCLDSAPSRWINYDLEKFIRQARAERSRLLGEDDPQAWTALAAEWDAMPRPFHGAYSHFRAASALLTIRGNHAAPHRDEAALHIEKALAACERLGASVLADEVVRLAVAAGIKPRPVAPSLGKPLANTRFDLTARESEVLALLVRGQTNGQIARQLGIETRTASVHVSNIIHKLGAANRVDAAVKAGDLGLIER